LHPISYAIWYEYVAGSNPALMREIDELTSNGSCLDEMQTLDLYSRHVGRLRADEAKKLQERFQEILKRMNTSAAEVDQRATAYGSALEDFGSEIAAAASPDEAQAGINKVLGHTRQMQASVVALKQRLEESRREAEQLRNELSRTREEALTDGLTGLVNRRGLDQVLREQIEAAAQQPAGLSVAVADLDHFKYVNDTYGHAFGDRVLMAVADILKANVKGKDTAARYGGEEFVILMPDTPLDGARVLAEQVRTSVARCVVKRGDGEESVGNFSISLGVTRLHPGETLESVFKRADEALYVSKKRGRNCVTVLQ
jgi:diguanylate cyclase